MSHDFALNAALGFFHKHITASTIWEKVGFVGNWQPLWKEDVLLGTQVGESGKYQAVLSLYEDAASTLKRGLYLEVTRDSVTDARKRAVDAGFRDVTVHADEHQRYVIARKAR